MARTRVHTCIYFDDGEPELLCVCGARGLYLVEDDGDSLLVALLDEDATHPAAQPADLREDFAISA